DDLRKMREQLRAAMRAGAVGFTTSRAPSHETMDGKPVASRIASWDEVRELVAEMGRAGGGVFEVANEPDTRSPDLVKRRAAQKRLEDLALDFGANVAFGVFPFAEPAGAWRGQLASCDDVAAKGGRMFAQTHSRGINVILSFRTQLPFDRLPEWR